MDKLEERKLIIEAARNASLFAYKTSTNLHLPIMFVKGKSIVIQDTSTTIVKIKDVKLIESRMPLFKGMIIQLNCK